MDTIFIKPEPAKKPDNNAKALAAWFAADTEDKQAAAVKSFPELANIFSQALTIKTKE